MRIVVTQDTCTGCEACVASCPYTAIVMTEGKAFINEYCQLCRACLSVCPEGAIKEVLDEGEASSARKARFEDYSGVWVFAEQRNGKVASVAYELLGVGRRLADDRKADLSAVLFGASESEAQELIRWGADVVFHAMNPLFEKFNDEPYTALLTMLINEHKPEIVLAAKDGITSNQNDDNTSDLPIKTIMQEQPLLISPETSIKDVHQKMHQFELPDVLIGKENHLHGIVTHKELLAPYAGFEKEETIAIQFHHRNTKVQGFDKEQAVDLLRSEFLKNYEKYLEIGYLHVSLEQYKETKQGLFCVVCEMKLSGKPGVFYATQEGYGPHQAMRNAYLAIEHQINKAKKT